MKKYFPKLFQQVLALLLCTAMLLPMAVQPVTAAEDIYILV